MEKSAKKNGVLLAAEEKAIDYSLQENRLEKPKLERKRFPKQKKEGGLRLC